MDVVLDKESDGKRRKCWSCLDNNNNNKRHRSVHIQQIGGGLVRTKSLADRYHIASIQVRCMLETSFPSVSAADTLPATESSAAPTRSIKLS